MLTRKSVNTVLLWSFYTLLCATFMKHILIGSGGSLVVKLAAIVARGPKFKARYWRTISVLYKHLDFSNLTVLWLHAELKPRTFSIFFTSLLVTPSSECSLRQSNDEFSFFTLMPYQEGLRGMHCPIQACSMCGCLSQNGDKEVLAMASMWIHSVSPRCDRKKWNTSFSRYCDWILLTSNVFWNYSGEPY